MVFLEQRIHTITEQVATIQPNEVGDGIVLITAEVGTDDESRLYLTFDEAEVLATVLQQTILRLKK